MLSITKRHLKKAFHTLLLLLGLFVTIMTFKQVGLRIAYQDLLIQSTQNLNNLVSYIDKTLGQFEKIPEVLSKHPLLQEVLISPENEQKTQQLNILLKEMSQVSETSDIYLINKFGSTIAASNWDKESSFVGNDLTVRPYFHEALAGKLSRYYAVGLTSNKRGYFFAYPVKNKTEIIGVIAIKVSVDSIENQYAQDVDNDNYNFLIVAPDNVVFISDKKEWRLSQIAIDVHPKNSTQNNSQLTKIEQQRYSQRQVSTLQVSHVNNDYLPIIPDVQLFNLTTNQETVFAQQTKMPLNDWRVHIWSSLQPINEQNILMIFIGSGSYFLLVMLVLFTKEKIRNTRQQLQAKLLLEQRVKERTEDLTVINKRLVDEISQRKMTQVELKKTQEELIQAAKLAVVGNMSASINHEINQPLTAIKSYSQNALTYQERKMPDKVQSNLVHIIALTDRLANIVSQFKNFTKKSVDIKVPILVQNSLSETLSIIKHQAQKESVEIITHVPDEELYILGDGIRLEQVFVNIISNGIQAIKDLSTRQIHVKVERVGQQVNITFRDSGPGILATNLDKVFEPFFTTKESFGLGIGLSISQRIIELMQGTLVVNNHKLGGAIFTISLPIYTNKANQ